MIVKTFILIPKWTKRNNIKEENEISVKLWKAVKKAECQRIDAFELWCWRRLLRVPWTARRSNQSILKEISPGCSLEGLILQYFGHLMGRVDPLEKTDAGRDRGQEEKGITEDEMAVWHHWLNGHEFEWTPGVGDGQGGLACCDSWGRKESDTTEQLNSTDERPQLHSTNPEKPIEQFRWNWRMVPWDLPAPELSAEWGWW